MVRIATQFKPRSRAPKSIRKLVLKPRVDSFEPRDPENPEEAIEFNRFIEELREQSRLRRYAPVDTPVT